MAPLVVQLIQWRLLQMDCAELAVYLPKKLLVRRQLPRVDCADLAMHWLRRLQAVQTSQAKGQYLGRGPLGPDPQRRAGTSKWARKQLELPPGLMLGILELLPPRTARGGR